MILTASTLIEEIQDIDCHTGVGVPFLRGVNEAHPITLIAPMLMLQRSKTSGRRLIFFPFFAFATIDTARIQRAGPIQFTARRALPRDG